MTNIKKLILLRNCRPFALKIHIGVFLAVTLCLCSSTYSFAAINLLPNPGFETVDPGNGARPQGWSTGRWGTNTTSFLYPSQGIDGTKGVVVSMVSRTTGDAKWITAPVLIGGGKVYEYTDSYISNVATHVTLEITMDDGSIQYPDIGAPAKADDWTVATYRFTAPTNARSVRVFHLINQVGTLKVDSVSLTEIEPPPPSDPDNLIKNPSVETVDGNNLPVGWFKGRWGTNTTNFVFPAPPRSGTRALGVDVTSWSSGDAKWYFDDVVVIPGSAYEFTDYYKSSVPSVISVRFKYSNGTYTYLDLSTRAVAPSWTEFRAPFTVPAGVVSLTVFHLLKQNGTLQTDSFSLKKLAQDPTKFDKGYVSLNFDDGWLSVYENAMPKLNAAGFKSDQYIVTDYLTGNYPGYVKPSQVLDMQSKGHVIGAHTRSHPDLTWVSLTQARQEIEGSRQDLRALGVTPVNTFGYPLGAYNASIQQLVKDTGYVGARSSDGGSNDKEQDIFALRRQSMEVTTTFTQVKGYIDTAMTEKKWVILLFHEINVSGHRYSITPELFQEIIDYLKQKNIIPITIEQGLALMKS